MSFMRSASRSCSTTSALGQRRRVGEVARAAAAPSGSCRRRRSRCADSCAEPRSRAAVASATSTSISTAPPRGSAATPIAERLWRPASPNTSASSRLAPSTTAGCCAKPGARRDEAEHGEHALDAIERSPSSARSTDSAFSAHQRAASAPCSTVRSPPSTPGMHELAVVVARELTRRARPAAVHDDRVERIVRRVRARQRRARARRAGRRSCSQPPLQEGRTSRRRATCAAVEHVVHERVVGRAELRVDAAQRRDGLARAASTGKIMSSVPFSTSSGRGAIERGDVEVLDRAELAGQDLRAAHVPRDRVRGPPRRQVARRRPRRGRVRRARRGTACTSRRTRARPRRSAPGSTSGCAREHVERALRDPRGCARAARRRPSWRTRDPSRSGTCRRASSRRARRSRAGRARARRSPRSRARARTSSPRRAPRSSTPQMRDLPGPWPWIASTAGPGSVAIVRHEQVRGHRHRRLGVEHDAVAAVRAAVDGLGRLEIERHRLGRRAEHREQPFAHVRARHGSSCVGEVVERARIGVDRGVVAQPPVRPVGEVAPPAHACSRTRRRAPSRARPTGGAGTRASPTRPGSARGSSRTPGPSPSAKHHASG